MPFCPQCGSDNPASARFCDQCGAQLIPVPAQAAAPAAPAVSAAPAAPAPTGAPIAAGPSACPQCGTAVIPGEAFCDSCGASLLAPAPAVPAPAAPTLPYGGVPPQPAYPPPQPVGAAPQPIAPPPPVAAPPIVTPPIVTPPTPPPVAARTTLMPATLTVKATGASVALPVAGQAVVGRADPVSNVFPDVDLAGYGALENGVGRRHARLFIQSGQVLLEDLDSTNGTFLNGARLAPRQPQTVKSGDELRLGNLVLGINL